jgi:hypothetical protein
LKDRAIQVHAIDANIALRPVDTILVPGNIHRREAECTELAHPARKGIWLGPFEGILPASRSKQSPPCLKIQSCCLWIVTVKHDRFPLLGVRGLTNRASRPQRSKRIAAAGFGDLRSPFQA